jgi:prefoldin subunit 5
MPEEINGLQELIEEIEQQVPELAASKSSLSIGC